jgi:hypothetical protein
MANKGVFIGLGGAGVKATGHLKAKLLRAAGGHERLRENCRFIFIDTDDRDVSKLNETYREQFGDETPLIEENERIDLSGVNPLAQYSHVREKARNKRADERERRILDIIDPKSEREFKNEPLLHGASANRQQGRMAVWAKSGEIQGRIREAVNILKNPDRNEREKDPVYFYLLSGTCGGTGSSAFLDVAYMLDREYKRGAKAGDPPLRAVLFMPHWYVQRYRSEKAGQRVVENYQCNAHAFFDEINHFLKDRYDPAATDDDGSAFSPVAVDPVIDRDMEGSDRLWRLFSFALLIDSTTEQGASLTDDQMYANTAELLYYWHSGSTQATLLANLDNTLTTDYVSTPKEQPVAAFATAGYRALQFPSQLMRDYFRRRFLYELFHYGLVGHSYEDAFPDPDERRREFEQIFQQCIGRYLFKEQAVEGVPNLAKKAGETIERDVMDLSDSDFLGEGGFLRGKGDYDADKISDAQNLATLITYAGTIGSTTNRKLERAFDAGQEKTSREKLLQTMRQGAQVKESAARTGSLEGSLEEAVLRFGLRYAMQLAGELDVAADARLNQLESDLAQRRARLNQLEAEIESARAVCLSEESGKRDRKNGFVALFAGLQERIRVSAQSVVLAQQIRLLNDLSEGDSGLLDRYRKNLKEMLRAARERLMGSDEDRDVVPGLADSYKTHLPKLFSATTNDVTTTYIPDVASFSLDQQWTSDHKFARLYGRLVQQQSKAGGDTEPVRYGRDYGRHGELKGLHHMLVDMLTERRIAGGVRGHEQDGEVAFFRNFFRDENPDTPQAFLNRAEAYAAAYVEHLMLGSQELQDEINKPLINRLKDDLDAEGRRRVIDQFADTGTQAFCRMKIGGREPSVQNIYVGSPELAQKLGFRAEGHAQRIDGETPNRFLKIKVLTKQTSDQYPHHESYEQIYATVRAERQLSGDIFAPHIHRVFNEHGVREGMGLITQPESDELKSLFAGLLLYREMFDVAAAAHPQTLAEIVYVNPDYRGQRRTHHSPLIIEGDHEQKALACRKLERHEGKLMMAHGNYVNAAGSVRSYKDIYDGLTAQPAVVAVARELDEFFRRHCSRAWLRPFDEADVQLRGKLASAPDEAAFADELSNSYVDFSSELRKVIAAKQDAAGRRPLEVVPAAGGEKKAFRP